MVHSSGTEPAESFEAIARAKMSRVLGSTRAEQLFRSVLEQTGLSRLQSAEDLLIFAQALAKAPAFEGAVGSMLCVTAVMAGATDSR